MRLTIGDELFSIFSHNHRHPDPSVQVNLGRFKINNSKNICLHHKKVYGMQLGDTKIQAEAEVGSGPF